MKTLFSIAILLLAFAAIGQKAYMTLDTAQMRIGEQTTLRISFEYNNPKEDALIGWPQFDEELTDKIEIIEKTVDYESLIDSSAKTYLRQQQMTISVFEPGFFTIPPVEIELNDQTYLTNELALFVNTVEVDTSKGIVDIKPKYEVDYSFSEMASDWFKTYWMYLSIGALVVALFLLFRYLRNRKQPEPETEAPKIPAHITALEVLTRLLLEEEWKTENKKEYYSSMTDTVRRYLEERFNIFALEQTTREIIHDLKNADISDEDKVFLKKILNQADMVKFAKFNPADEDGYISLKQSIEFVERTKKSEEDQTHA